MLCRSRLYLVLYFPEQTCQTALLSLFRCSLWPILTFSIVPVLSMEIRTMFYLPYMAVSSAMVPSHCFLCQHREREREPRWGHLLTYSLRDRRPRDQHSSTLRMKIKFNHIDLLPNCW